MKNITLPAALLVFSIIAFMVVFENSDQQTINSDQHLKTNDFPSTQLLQEMHDLAAEKTRLKINKRFYNYQIKNKSKNSKDSLSQIQIIDKRFTEIKDRLNEIYKTELGKLERVATDAGTMNSEEPRYVVGSYGIILSANALSDIKAGELLLFHANDVFRTRGTFSPLETNGQGWYFRPSKNIKNGNRFVVSCIQDAPEEIANVKKGFMPDSDRARNLNRSYNTNTFIKDL